MKFWLFTTVEKSISTKHECHPRLKPKAAFSRSAVEKCSKQPFCLSQVRRASTICEITRASMGKPPRTIYRPIFTPYIHIFLIVWTGNGARDKNHSKALFAGVGTALVALVIYFFVKSFSRKKNRQNFLFSYREFPCFQRASPALF